MGSVSSAAILRRLRASVDAGCPLVVAGVGSGLTARGAVSGGADVLAAYSTAIYRIRGLSTALAFLPYDDANALTLGVAREVILNAGTVPVLLGFGAHDPRWPLDVLLDKAEEIGAAGVTNEPFIGIYGTDLRAQLEAAGLGFSRELALIKQAVARGMLALGWAFNAHEAKEMAKVGAQLIGAMVGVTAGGPAGGTPLMSIDLAVESVCAMAQAAKEIREDAIVLAHGGPFNDPRSVAVLLASAPVDGYVTGSTAERMPVEAAVGEAIRQFKNVRSSPRPGEL